MSVDLLIEQVWFELEIDSLCCVVCIICVIKVYEMLDGLLEMEVFDFVCFLDIDLFILVSFELVFD